MGRPTERYGEKTKRIIRALNTYPGMTATWLANHLKEKPAIVCTTLNRLKKRGLVIRERKPSKLRRNVSAWQWWSIRSF